MAGRLAGWIAAVLLAGAVLVVSTSLDSRAASLAGSTWRFCLVVTGLALAVGTPLAWLVMRTDLPLRRLWFALLCGMFLVPLYVQAGAWQAALGYQGALATRFGLGTGFDGWSAAVVVNAAAAVPWVMVFVGLGLARVEPELEELAVLEGPAWSVLTSVTLRRALPAVAAAAAWIFVATAADMTVTDLFRVRTLAEEVYTEIAVEPSQTPLTTWAVTGTLGGFLVAASAALAAFVPLGREVPARPGWVFKLDRWRWPGALVAALLAALVVGMPLSSLAWKVGVIVEQGPAGRLRTWSLEKFASVLVATPGANVREIGWSLVIGALAAASAALLALPLAWWARHLGMKAWPGFVLAGVLLAVPGPVLGLAIVELFNQPQSEALIWLYDRTIAPVWLAQTLRIFPCVFILEWFMMRTVPEALVECAKVEGHSAIGVVVTVVCPLMWPALLAAWLLGLALAVGELAATSLVSPPLVETIATRVWGKLHTGCEDDVAAMCLILCVAAQAAAAAAAMLVTRSTRRLK